MDSGSGAHYRHAPAFDILAAAARRNAVGVRRASVVLAVAVAVGATT